MLDLAELIETQKKSKSYCIQCYMGKCGSSRGGGGSGGSGVCPNPIRDDAEFKRLVKYLNDPLQINTIKKEMTMGTENDFTIRVNLYYLSLLLFQE